VGPPPSALLELICFLQGCPWGSSRRKSYRTSSFITQTADPLHSRYAQLVGLRVCLGFVEAGLFQAPFTSTCLQTRHVRRFNLMSSFQHSAHEYSQMPPMRQTARSERNPRHTESLWTWVPRSSWKDDIRLNLRTCLVCNTY